MRHALAILFSLLALTARADLNRGLVLHYSMEGATASTVPDASPSGCHGQVVNAQPDAQGVQGGCLRFDGRSAYVRAPFNPARGGQYTVALWFKPEPAALHRLNSCNLVAMNRRYQIGFNTNGPHYRLYSFCSNAGNYGYGALRADSGLFDLEPDRWYHVALVAEDGGAAFFFNGRPLGFVSGAAANEGDRDLLVGALDNGPGPRYFFPGWIDEVRLYDRALTVEEMSELFLQEAPASLRPAPATALGAAYTIRDGRLYARTPDGRERLLSDEEAGSLLQSAASRQAAATTEPEPGPVCDIGFSTAEKGDQDVTYFMPDETLHIRVRDVDAATLGTNFILQAYVRQDQVSELKALERRRDGSFRIAIPLQRFQPGPVWISVVGAESGSQPILMRTSRIHIIGPEGLPAPQPPAILLD
jgi:hypothetical protein